jgi:hypothetical protein
MATSRPLVLLALVALAGLTGCTASESTPDPSPISAREALEQAQDTLETWNGDAQLVVASGFEGGDESPAVQREDRQEEHGAGDGYPVYADPLPGDGRAPQWVMVFLADEETRTLRVNTEETSWMDEGGQPAGEGARPAGNWSVDSTEALDRATNGSQAWDEIVATRDVTVFLTLSGGEAGPYWRVQASSHAAGQRNAFVDARTGEVRQQPPGTEASARTFTGTLAAGEDNRSHALEVDEAGADVSLELAWNASADDVRLNATLARGDARLEANDTEQAASRLQASWTELAAGEHAIEVHAEQRPPETSVDYELGVQIET